MSLSDIVNNFDNQSEEYQQAFRDGFEVGSKLRKVALDVELAKFHKCMDNYERLGGSISVDEILEQEGFEDAFIELLKREGEAYPDAFDKVCRFK